jgi:hypothetical protein
LKRNNLRFARVPHQRRRCGRSGRRPN